MRPRSSLALLALGAGVGVAPRPPLPDQAGITRTELQRRDLSIPGRELIQVRVDFTVGAGFGKHSHPGEEIAYVLQGVLEYQLENVPPVTLRAGEVLFIPAGTTHSARNVGGGHGAELATYVVKKGRPLVVTVR